MARISKEQAQHVAHLARLKFSDEELEKLTTELDAIIGYAELLDEVDTTGIKPTSHVLDMKNVMREDTPEKGASREELLKNAPDHKDGLFKVPSAIE